MLGVERLIVGGRGQQNSAQQRCRRQPAAHQHAQDCHAHRRAQNAQQRPLQLTDLIIVGRQHKRLAGQHERRNHQESAAQSQHADARQHEDLGGQTEEPCQKEHHLQPAAGAVQVLAPEVDDECHHRHEASQTEAGRVQFDVEARAADQEQQPCHLWAGQCVEQPIGPTWLRQGDIA